MRRRRRFIDRFKFNEFLNFFSLLPFSEAGLRANNVLPIFGKSQDFQLWSNFFPLPEFQNGKSLLEIELEMLSKSLAEQKSAFPRNDECCFRRLFLRLVVMLIRRRKIN